MDESLLIITHSFPPASSPASIRMLEFSRNLSTLGWDVHILCPRRTYYPRQDPALLSQIPSSVSVHRTRVWDLSYQLGQKHKLQDEATNSHVLTAVLKDGNACHNWLIAGLKQLRRRLFYPDIYITWAPSLLYSGARLCRKYAFSAILATGDPWSVVIVASWLAKLTKTLFVADFRELWSGHSHRTDQQLNRWYRKSEERIFRRSALVVANSPCEREILEVSCAIPNQPRFIDIENGFDPNELVKCVEGCQPVSKEPFTIAYAGSFGYRKPDAFFLALAAWLGKDGLANRKVLVKIVGPIEERVLGIVNSLHLNTVVEFHGYLGRAQMFELLWHSHVLLTIVGTPVNQNFDPTVPAKMYEYASTGKPILLLAKPGGAIRFFDSIGSFGVSVDNEDTSAIQRALEELYQRHTRGELSSNCILSVREYTRQALTAKLSSELLRLLRQHEMGDRTPA